MLQPQQVYRMSNPKYVLTTFSLTMITVGSVDSIRNLPATALFGSQLISFFILGAIFFFVPTALVSAELASAWPQQGGIYIWVKEAFGKRIGFLAIWLQWIANVIWYPTILSFVAGTIGYLINPELITNAYFLWVVITSCFWATTLLNLYGMRSSAIFSNICALFGLLLPMTLIISLGINWVLSGHTIQIPFDIKSIIPHWQDVSIWVSLTAIMMSFCGIEIATVHANDVANPQHSFPRALLYSMLIILSTLILGSLAIAIVLPQHSIHLVAGIMQAFDAFFAKYELGWLMPFVALMLVIGGLGGVSNWIIAPTRGLLVAAEDCKLPEILQRVNKGNMPSLMLIAQAVIVTFLSGMFLFMPSVNESYWLLTAMAAQLYMFMYLLMFAAAIKLRLRRIKQQRAFRIPGGLVGIFFVTGLGIIGCIVTLLVSFMPPIGIDIENLINYELTLILGVIFLCLPPFVVTWLQSHRSAAATDTTDSLDS